MRVGATEVVITWPLVHRPRVTQSLSVLAMFASVDVPPPNT